MISMLPIPLSCGRCRSAGLVGDRATTNMPAALRSTGRYDCTSSGPGCTPTHAILQWQLSPPAHTAWTHRKLQAQVRMLEMYWRLPKASQPANECCFVECRHDGSRAASPTFTSLLHVEYARARRCQTDKRGGAGSTNHHMIFASPRKHRLLGGAVVATTPASLSVVRRARTLRPPSVWRHIATLLTIWTDPFVVTERGRGVASRRCAVAGLGAEPIRRRCLGAAR